MHFLALRQALICRSCRVALAALGLFANAQLLHGADEAIHRTPSEVETESGDEDTSMFAGDDGHFDVGSFLDQAYGFLPVAMPITEPAVGYGLAGGVAFISAPLGSATAVDRPNITILGGMRTENGTEGAAAADIRYWNEGRVQTQVAAFSASVNLDYYGIGDNEILANHPLRYNLDPQLGMAQGKYRLGDSALWVGLGYVYADIDIGFDTTSSRIPDYERNSKVAGLLPSMSYDTRDNVFTPIRGSYLEVSGGWFGNTLGSDEDFQRLRLTGLHFAPLAPDWYLGLRFEGVASFRDPPFYLQPFVSLRGVPAMRYQGDEVAQVEAEVRWQLWHRFSLLGFAGVGQTWADTERDSSDREVIPAGGLGFRYEIARKYGIHMGVDIAVSEEDEAIYVQVGSAWARP